MLRIFSRRSQTGDGGSSSGRRGSLSGKLIDRRYRVINLLGEGGFSHTYVAEDTRRPKNPDYPKCVVKHLRKNSRNPDFLTNARRLFRTEAETLEKLGRHNQIPQLLAYLEERGEFYLVQEYIEGHPLSAELQPGRCWQEPRVYAFLQEMLEILAFVHDEGVIHRDIKPDNIIRRRHDRKLCLVDFGTVKQAVSDASPDSLRRTITTGTPGYISIEQWQGNPQLSSDLYALGIVAIQALTGTDPEKFQGNPERFLRQYHRPIDPALVEVISNMVRPDWQERYPSAREVLQALQPLAQRFASAAAVDVPPPTDFPDSPSQTIISPPSYPPAKSPSNPLDRLGNGSAAETGLAWEEANPPTYLIGEHSPTSHPSETAPADANPTYLVNHPITPSYPSASPTSINKELPGQSLPHDEPEAESTAVVSPAAPPGSSSKRGKLMAGLTALGAAAIAAGVVLLVLPWQASQAAKQTLQQAKEHLQAKDYDDCAARAREVPAKFGELKSEAERLAGSCSVLMQANQLANRNDWRGAIAKLESVSSNAPTYGEAQTLLGQWGDRLLQQATEKYQKGDLKGAIALLANLPPVLQPKVQSRVTQWQTNQNNLQTAQSALKAGNWQAVLDALKKINPDDSVALKNQIAQLRQQAQSSLDRVKVAPATEQPAAEPFTSTSVDPSPRNSYAAPRRYIAPSAPRAPENPSPRQDPTTGSTICPPRVPGCS
jgi:serine/threonine-protein kinase